MSIATEIQRLQTAKINIKTAIENKGVTVGDGTIDTYAEKISEISSGGSGDYDQGYEDGKNSVVPIERYLKIAQFTSLNIFGKSEAELNLDNTTNLNGLFSIRTEDDINKTVEHLIINCPNLVISLNIAFNCDKSLADKKLKRVTMNVDTQNATSFNGAFAYLEALEVIDGYPLNATSCTVGLNNLFRGCSALIEVRFVPNTIKIAFSTSMSPNLSAETIQSIIDGLVDLTGGTAQTLTLHATVGAKLTDEQKSTITAKNWTLVY